MMKLHSVMFIFVLTAAAKVKEDFFTSTFYLENLLKLEGEVVDILKNHLKVEESKLENLKWYRSQLNNLGDKFANNTDSYILNPVTSFSLLKRLSRDLTDLTYLTEKLKPEGVSTQLKERQLNLPRPKDLKGASEAIFRLQDVYLLNTSEVLSLPGRDNFTEFTADDFYQLGLQAYIGELHNHTLYWMQEALYKLDTDSNKTIDKTKLLDYMSYAAYKTGNAAYATELAIELIKTDPTIRHAYNNLILFQDSYVRNVTPKPDKVYDERTLKYHGTVEKYSELCRNKQHNSNIRLRCFYTHNNNSFLLLQPVKVEQFSLNPHIVVYHDVLSDGEAEVLKGLAKPKLERAQVSDVDTGAPGFAEYRISKSAYFADDEHGVVARLSQRISQITSLSLTTAEILHIINYGIGGQYEPHYDFSFIDDFEKSDGNRIATWIFYLNDVQAGGSTVFPRIGVSVKPRKGSAVFWYNLYRNGTGILDTEHAGCPVLSGSKWIATKWFHEGGHEISRPCSLNLIE